MAYTIHISVVQLCGTYDIVEQTTWNNTYWTQHGGTFVLHLANSGSSGMLRFRDTSNNTSILVAVGVHNYKRWCDIVTDLDHNQVGAKYQPLYYGDHHSNGTARGKMLWKQLHSIEKITQDARVVSLNFTTTEGHDLYATLTIDKLLRRK